MPPKRFHDFLPRVDVMPLLLPSKPLMVRPPLQRSPHAIIGPHVFNFPLFSPYHLQLHLQYLLLAL